MMNTVLSELFTKSLSCMINNKCKHDRAPQITKRHFIVVSSNKRVDTLELTFISAF